MTKAKANEPSKLTAYFGKQKAFLQESLDTRFATSKLAKKVARSPQHTKARINPKLNRDLRSVSDVPKQQSNFARKLNETIKEAKKTSDVTNR